MGRVEKARESLKAAQLLYSAECYNSCASRCYYAMFQMAIAALIKMGIKPPHPGEYSHTWVQAEVAKELIHRKKILPARLASALPEAMKARSKADYEESGISKRSTWRLLKLCQEFINYLETEVIYNEKI